MAPIKSVSRLWVFAAAIMQCVEAGEPVRTPAATTTRVESAASVSTLTPIARARAERWGLSPVEWLRYESLMTGIRGSISPSTISPIEVLGIHARDAAERQQYAERWAQMMREDVARILTFQRAYDAAGRRLYPNETLIAAAPATTPSPVDNGLTPQDRILFFTAPDCAPCDAALQDVLSKLDRIAGIDIYLSQLLPSESARVRAWAAGHAIAPDWVKTGRVTLNFEAGTLAKLGQGKVTLPVTMRRRGDAIFGVPSDARR